MVRRIIPTLFTLGNLYCGFLSIGYVAMGETKNAAILVIIGMMLDSMDGRLARMLHVQSTLGKELDSLADIVTFGVAASFLIHATVFANDGLIGLFIAGLFPLFGAYRLARYNVTPASISMKHFTGIPITAAGGIVALMTLFSQYLDPLLIVTVFIALCFLMVSTIKIPSFKDIPIPKYSAIVTIFLFSVICFVGTTQKDEWPFFLYIAIPLYIFFFIVQLRWKKYRQNHPPKRRWKLHRNGEVLKQNKERKF